jgi:hypothetical protein
MTTTTQIKTKKALLASLAAIPIAIAGNIAFADVASASYSLVPQQEGEIDVGLTPGVLGLTSGPGVSQINYPIPTNTRPYISKIESLVDSTTGAKSRLFVDHLATANNYGNGTVVFQATDAGTVPTGYWYRPSEVTEEKGQLEVGTFKFTFNDGDSNDPIPFLKVLYFDTESTDTTGVPTTDSPNFSGNILDTDGTLYLGENPVLQGRNANIYEQVWRNVTYITLKLGKDYTSGTGDGVDFQLYSAPVPEPITLLGSGIALSFGTYLKRKLKEKQKI